MPHRSAIEEQIAELQRGLMDCQDERERARIHLDLGRIAMAEGRLDSAVRHLREALLLDRRLDQARQMLVDLGEASRLQVNRVRHRRGSVRNLLGRMRHRDKG